MKINPTNNYIYPQQIKKVNNSTQQAQTRENSTFQYSSIGFGCVLVNGSKGVTVNGLRKVSPINEISTEVYRKISGFLKRLPQNSEMKEPKFFTIGDEKLAFLIKKGNSDTELVIDRNVETLADWNKNNGYKKEEDKHYMTCLFNERGLMKKGKLYFTNKSGKNSKISLLHTGKEGRRVEYGDEIFRPILGNITEWAIVPNKNSRNTAGKDNLFKKFENVLLSDLFIEFANNKTTILM